MSRKWKNSDDFTVFTDRALENKLEKLRMELIENYSRKYNKTRRNNKKKNQPKSKKSN